MPITDNSFTGQELEAALKANPALMTIVKGTLTDQKMTVRTEAEETAFATNLESSIVAKKTSEHATALEADVLELTGIKKKGSDEKYYDYFKRAVAEKLASVKALEAELTELKGKHNPSEVDKKRIQQLEAAVAEKEAALQTKTTEMSQKILELQAGSQIDAAIAEFRAQYRKDIPESVSKIVESQIRQQLLAKAKMQDDGTLTILDEKGEVIVNKADYKPEQVKNIIKGQLTDLLDPGRQQQGAGSSSQSQQQQGAGGGGGGSFTRLTALPSDIKSKTALTDHMLKAGYLDGSKEFSEDFDKLGASLPLK